MAFVHSLLLILSISLTAWLGYFTVLFPVVLLLPFSYVLYRGYCDHISEVWFVLPVALLEHLCGIRFVFSGDLEFPKGDRAIMIMNHRTRLDWLFLWNWLFRFGRLRNHKIVLKDSLKRVPGFGWAMQQFGFLFLKRSWTEDRMWFDKILKYYVGRSYPLQLLLFPEGTDLSPSNKQKSIEWAKKNDLPKYEYLLQPRLRGFSYAVELLRSNVDAVYDLTVGYPDSVPDSEKTLFSGKFPSEIHFHCKRYDIKSLPREEKELEQWCSDRWREKEKFLTGFYEKNKKFPGPQIQSDDYSAKNATYFLIKQFIFLMIWIFVMIGIFYYLFTSSAMRWYYLAGNIFMVVVTQYFKGWDWIEASYLSLQ